MLRRLAMLTLLAAGLAAVTTKVTSKSQATEKRVNQLAGQLSTANGQLAQLNIAALANFQSAPNTLFLSGLSKLPHQTTSNAGGAGNDSFTGPYWGSGERGFLNTDSTSISGLANAVNILQGNLQSNGFQS